ncbi:MAG TPA: chemotaxis protein CheW [Pirellulales bacterium]|nr:chemotaxis protein CheW [Pirellulales bacterium]
MQAVDRNSRNVDSSVKSTTSVASSAGEKMVILSIGQQRYAIPLAAVQEVLPLSVLSRPPRMPLILDGFLHLGETAVAVVNLPRLFNLPDAPTALYTPILLLRGSPPPIALKVDRVLGVVWVSDDAKMRLDDRDGCNGCLQGVAIIDDRVVIILSPQQILLSQETERLADLLADEQRRIDALQEAAS